MKHLSLKQEKKKPVKKKQPDSATTSKSKKKKTASKENHDSVGKTDAEKDIEDNKTVKDKTQKDETDKEKVDKDKTDTDKAGKDSTSGNEDSNDIVVVKFDDPSLHIDTDENKLKCPTCLKIQKPQTYQYHIVACRKKKEKQKAKAKEKNFVCIHDGCNKRFKYNRELENHARLHTGRCP